MRQVFETASFHIVKPCNMKCKFCYATFDDFHVGPQLPAEDAYSILSKLRGGGLEKITFAGGEPLMYRHLDAVIEFAHSIGLVTSIITNGSLITDAWLGKMAGKLDWIGISIDSLNEQTNASIGRQSKLSVNYHSLIERIKRAGFKLKINTVVNAFNKDEDMNAFISWAAPLRWKIFQTLRVEGQNDEQFDGIKCSADEFNAFVSRHAQQAAAVPENNAAMTGSYLLIDPLGRLFENSKGRHTYSQPLANKPLSECLAEIEVSRETFIDRGGLYQW